MTYCLTVRLRAVEGQEDQLAEGMRVMEAASRQEEAVVEWRVFRSTDDPRRFLIYELYRDASGLDAHRETDHFAWYQREILPLIESREPSSWEPLTDDRRSQSMVALDEIPFEFDTKAR